MYWAKPALRRRLLRSERGGGHERTRCNTWGGSLPERTPAVEVVPHAAVHVSEDTKSDVLIDFTDSYVVYCEGLTLLLTAQRLAHSEDRQVWLMGLPDNAWTVLEAMGLADLFVRIGSPGEFPH